MWVRRSPLEITLKVLEICRTPKIQDDIIRGANICRKKIKEMINNLVQVGLLENDIQQVESGWGRGSLKIGGSYFRQFYKTTEKGNDFIREATEMFKLLSVG